MSNQKDEEETNFDPMSDEFRRERGVTDKQWARTHSSWKALRPHAIAAGLEPDDETAEQYAERIGLPLALAEHYHYAHFYAKHVINSYGWIDHDKAEWVLERWPTERLLSLPTLFPDAVEEVAAETSWPDRIVDDELRQSWLEKGTWVTPPPILDLEGLGQPPAWADIKGRYQLMEGHTRLGILNSVARHRPELLAKEHEVFVLRARH